jgi:hypothetical protein
MKTIIDLIQPTKDGVIEVRQATYDENNEVTYHRWTLLPGQNVENQEQAVKDVCVATWTPEIILAYKAKTQN